MRRIAAILVLCVAVAGALIFGLGAGGDGGGAGYEVRAVFDNVASAVPGEDVKVAGAKVGAINSMDVTAGNKAAVVLTIDNAAFTPFHGDAQCTVRAQSLIGEKFVECNPGTTAAPALPEIKNGPGKGQHLLCNVNQAGQVCNSRSSAVRERAALASTSSPVDLDTVNDILRLPFRERLSILLNEFGTGLAGRGKDLNEAIHRANPALRDTDKVLAILASENKQLADLASNSDTVLEPLSRERAHVADFIVQANTTAEATAERSSDLEASIAKFPETLRQLRPLLTDLGHLSDEMTPVLNDLGEAAPSLNRFLLELGPFSVNAVPAFQSLGDAADVGLPALQRSDPLFKLLTTFGKSALPVSKLLDQLTASLQANGGIDRFMEFLFYQGTAINGFDGISHYLRAAVIVNLCSSYAVTPTAGCSANFTQANASAASTRTPVDPVLQDTQRVLRGGKPNPRTLADWQREQGVSKGEEPKPKSRSGTGTILRDLIGASDPRITQRRDAGIQSIRQGVAQSPPGVGGTRKSGDEAVADYLLGNDQR